MWIRFYLPHTLAGDQASWRPPPPPQGPATLHRPPLRLPRGRRKQLRRKERNSAGRVSSWAGGAPAELPASVGGQAAWGWGSPGAPATRAVRQTQHVDQVCSHVHLAHLHAHPPEHTCTGAPPAGRRQAACSGRSRSSKCCRSEGALGTSGGVHHEGWCLGGSGPACVSPTGAGHRLPSETQPRPGLDASAGTPTTGPRSPGGRWAQQAGPAHRLPGAAQAPQTPAPRPCPVASDTRPDAPGAAAPSVKWRRDPRAQRPARGDSSIGGSESPRDVRCGYGVTFSGSRKAGSRRGGRSW